MPYLIRPMVGVTWPNETRPVRRLGQKPVAFTVWTMFRLQSLLTVCYVLKMLLNGRRTRQRLMQLSFSCPSDVLKLCPVFLQSILDTYSPAAMNILLCGRLSV